MKISLKFDCTGDSLLIMIGEERENLEIADPKEILSEVEYRIFSSAAALAQSFLGYWKKELASRQAELDLIFQGSKSPPLQDLDQAVKIADAGKVSSECCQALGDVLRVFIGVVVKRDPTLARRFYRIRLDQSRPDSQRTILMLAKS